MAAKGYTTAALVAASLNKVFTASQQAECERVIEAIEVAIDEYKGRAWLVPVVTSQDYFDLSGPQLWLRSWPVTSIGSVKVLGAWNDTTETTLVSGTDYEQRDLGRGLLYLPVWQGYHRVRVTYTPSAAVPPANVRRAATEWTAWQMRPLLEGMGPGIKSFSVGGGDLSVSYQDAISTGGIPAEIKALLGGRSLVLA